MFLSLSLCPFSPSLPLALARSLSLSLPPSPDKVLVTPPPPGIVVSKLLTISTLRTIAPNSEWVKGGRHQGHRGQHFDAFRDEQLRTIRIAVKGRFSLALARSRSLPSSVSVYLGAPIS